MTGPALSLAELSRQFDAQQAQRPPRPGIRRPAAETTAVRGVQPTGDVDLRTPGAPSAVVPPSLAELSAQFDAQRAAPAETTGEMLGGGVRAFSQGALFGLADEGEALVRAPFEDRTYPQIRDDIRGQNRQFAQRHPIAAPVLEVAGGLAGAAFPIGGAARAATTGGRLLRAAGVGAGAGAAYGFGKGEGGAAAQVKSAAMGAATGAVLGGALQGGVEVGRNVMRSAAVGPRLANGVAAVLPTPRIQRWAAGRQAAAEDALVLEGMAQDATSPAQMLRRVADVPESIPVAVVDQGGENMRQQLGAIKRLPGPQKEAITQTMRTRQSNAPGQMERSVRDNTDNVAEALGLDPAAIDTRTANPNEVVKAARAALTERSNARFGALDMDAPVTYTPAIAKRLGKLLERPSLQRAHPVAGELARESGEVVAPLVADQGPTVRQLHYTKMALDEQIDGLERKLAGTVGKGDKAGTGSSRLAKLYRTRDEFTRLIDDVAPASYRDALRAHAAEAAPISAFQKGRRLGTNTLPEDVETLAAGQMNDNARAALGGGQARRIGGEIRRAGSANADPTKPVVGSGAADDLRVENLTRLNPKGAPAIQRDADAIQRIRRTNTAVMGNSATAERLGADASLQKKAGAVASLLRGKPIAFLTDVFSGAYGPTAEGAAKKLLTGANAGERQQLVDYLTGLANLPGPRAPRLRGRGTGALAGQASGAIAAAINGAP